MPAAIPGDPFSSFAGGFGASLGSSLGGAVMGQESGPQVMQSGAPVDARSFMDGSGWTVSTGTSSAKGGTVSRTGDPYGAPASFQPGAAPAAGGLGGLDPVTLAGLVLVLVLVARRRTN